MLQLLLILKKNKKKQIKRVKKERKKKTKKIWVYMCHKAAQPDQCVAIKKSSQNLIDIFEPVETCLNCYTREQKLHNLSEIIHTWAETHNTKIRSSEVCKKVFFYIFIYFELL